MFHQGAGEKRPPGVMENTNQDLLLNVIRTIKETTNNRRILEEEVLADRATTGAGRTSY